MAYMTKRQKEVHDYLKFFINKYGYSPSLKEICEYFGTTSLATMQRLLVKLENQGMIKRTPKMKRAIELVETKESITAPSEVPITGNLAENSPIVNSDMVRFMKMPDEITKGRYTYMLKVEGDLLDGENISDSDYVVIESKSEASDGDMALIRLDANNVVLRRIFREDGKIILQPTNPKMQTTVVKEEDVKIMGIMIGVFRNCLE